MKMGEHIMVGSDITNEVKELYKQWEKAEHYVDEAILEVDRLAKLLKNRGININEIPCWLS